MFMSCFFYFILYSNSSSHSFLIAGKTASWLLLPAQQLFFMRSCAVNHLPDSSNLNEYVSSASIYRVSHWTCEKIAAKALFVVVVWCSPGWIPSCRKSNFLNWTVETANWSPSLFPEAENTMWACSNPPLGTLLMVLKVTELNCQSTFFCQEVGVTILVYFCWLSSITLSTLWNILRGECEWTCKLLSAATKKK